MKKPLKGFMPPDFSGQSQILFCTEGNPTVSIVSNRSGRRRISTRSFAQAEAALAWCRASGVVMVYCPRRSRTELNPL